MVGFITERHLQQAEEAFPGIARFFERLSPKPLTFLDLLTAFEHCHEPSSQDVPRRCLRTCGQRAVSL